MSFVDPRTGATGQAQAVPLTGDTGTFWFFDPANLELMVKVLDAQGVNGHFWVFYGALSDVEYTITVTDTATGATRTLPQRSPPPGQRGRLDRFLIGRDRMKRNLSRLRRADGPPRRDPLPGAAPAPRRARTSRSTSAPRERSSTSTSPRTPPGIRSSSGSTRTPCRQSVQARLFDPAGNPPGLSFIVGSRSADSRHPPAWR